MTPPWLPPLRQLFLLAVLIAGAIGLLTVPTSAAPVPAHFTVSAMPMPARAGEAVTVTVQVAVDSGWHIYSVVPVSDGPSATEIKAFGDSVPLGPTMEDAPTKMFDDNFKREVGYHEKTATFQRRFKVTGPTQSVTLHYQTCNDHICLPPTDVNLALATPIAPGPARAAYAPTPTPVTTGPVSTGGKTTDSGLGLFLLAALGAGLVALATPCVFPLIPITLTSFVKQAGGDKRKLVQLSAGYALGIVLLYVALGAIVTATVGATGINNVASNPYVNLGIFIAFVVFALSFFETIHLTLPANLSALQSTAKQHGGLVGLGLLGITFVLASFTCTAPFVGTLLVAAAGGERFRPLLGTLVFALAFVSPFLVFALFPQWIARIPKGGLWLARVKATLGFVELAAALKFLSNADQVWNWQILTGPVLLAAWAILFFCAALYLWGTLKLGVAGELEEPGAKVPPVRAGWAVLFMVLAGYCFWGLSGRATPLLAAFLPPTGYGTSASGTGSDDGLIWLTDYKTALAQAKAEGKPLFIDFTGVTCTNCRWNEKNVFPKSAVKSALANFVRVRLYTDRPGDAANQKLQLTKFGDVALPLYGIVNPDTEAVVNKYAGTITDASDFTHFLTAAHQSAAPSASASTFEALAPWATYSPASLAAAQAAGKPIVVDFTADWCVNCKEIEHDVFENAAVAPGLAANFTTLRSDLTKWSSPEAAALEKKYGIARLPTIILLKPDGTEIKTLRITGRLSVADFQNRLKQAEAAE